MLFLILKLSDKDRGIPFNDDEELIKRANGNWRITPAKLGDTKKALLLFRGQVLEEYEINDVIEYNRATKRITFDMKLVDNSQYKGKILNYKTANPASIVDEDKLKDIIN